MTLKELLESVEWSDVQQELRSIDNRDNQLRGLRAVFDELQELPASPSSMRILLEVVEPEEEGEPQSFEVVGRNGRLNREENDFKYVSDEVDDEWADSEANFCLSLTRWEEWLGMQVDPATLAEIPAPRIIAHCLWDMTFHGFTQEKIREFEMELKRESDELDAMSPEEREEHLITADELFRLMDEDAEKSS